MTLTAVATSVSTVVVSALLLATVVVLLSVVLLSIVAAVVVASIVVASVGSDREVWSQTYQPRPRQTDQIRLTDDIVERAMLGDSDEDRLVVRSAVDGRQLVRSLGEAVGDFGGQDAVDSGCVDALEEGEFDIVEHGARSERVDLLNHNVCPRPHTCISSITIFKRRGMLTRVPDDLAVAVRLGRSREVRLLRIGERASLEVLDGQLNVERLVRRDRIEVGRVLELQSGVGAVLKWSSDTQLTLQLGILS